MRVTKWNDALAVQIPDDVAKSLDLKEGDEVEIAVTSGNNQRPVSSEEREKILAYIRSQRWKLPEGWKFNRDEANER
ncbi:antitoxin MazE [Rhizobium sp. NFR07]|uniref:AbrB/MazE/SpoVT family DNA-binding domain-containing protein n=1 Tax=Rhizobium sp. NFR07 TaxID=1566262 RepID=UPI0008F32329|nr:AbrB/MazE/SpoVT family DNA-binding domain-containing protein [Rhizobium sp. NFR07]SFB07348.1 antitoxin MazE [Rhizobium sp. NFR07]